MDNYAPWFEDFAGRLAQHDAGVDALAHDLASRTTWSIYAAGSGDFPDPPRGITDPPDVLCEREPGERAMWLELEFPETLVRRDTVARLRTLSQLPMVDVRLVLVTHGHRHERDIPEARRLLMRARLTMPVIALAPAQGLISGADW